MDFDDLAKRFSQQRVLILGDVMIDSYVYGQVSRISPEAPVPIVNVKTREERLGGAANVAQNIASLGAKPLICSVVGSDMEGRTLERLFAQAQMETAGLVRSPKRPTTVKHRILAGSQQLLRIDSEIDTQISQEDTLKLKDQIVSLLQQATVVIFEDYDKGLLHPELIEWVICEAQKRSIPTVVDPKKRNFLAYRNCTLFKPNLKELQEGLSVAINPLDLASLQNCAKLLQEKMPYQKLLLTLSENGIFLNENQQSYQIPAHKREIADVSGAGDTVVSIAALALACGVENKMLAELSNLGGGIVCESLGVVPISQKRLFEEAQKLFSS
jgi:rfaE bifunctional protein kinase chain/domain